MQLDLHSTFNPDVIRDEIRMITRGVSAPTNNNWQIDERQDGESHLGRITHGSHQSISLERQVEANIWICYIDWKFQTLAIPLFGSVFRMGLVDFVVNFNTILLQFKWYLVGSFHNCL